MNNMMKAWVFYLCLFSFSLHAKILKDEVVVVDEKRFSFQQVCKELTKRDSPLITYYSISKLDCMGEVIDASKYCDSKTQDDPYYIRAIVEKESRQVNCKSAKRVQIKYQCESIKDKFCKDKEIGCYLLQEKLAKRLKTAHASIVTNGKYKILNCHFTPKNEQLTIPIDQI